MTTGFFGGDLNMVEFYEDSSGVAVVIHGAEARKWARFQDDFDLLDIYLCASKRRSSWLTKPAIIGEHFDRARLDLFTAPTIATGLIL
jgi:hypothetical protein